MNQKTKNRISGITAGLMAVLLTITAVLGNSFYARAETLPEPEPIELTPGGQEEHIYGPDDPFEEAYSAGYFCIKDDPDDADFRAVGLTRMQKGEGSYVDYDCLEASNTSRSTSVYIDHPRGVCMNGVYYDVREYPWITGGNDGEAYGISFTGSNAGKAQLDVYGNVKSYRTGESAIHREFHFYKAGTLHTSNPVEVTFRGVMKFTDMDMGEGYTFAKGLKGVWLNRKTHVQKSGTNTWLGTWSNNNDGVNAYRETMWVEVEGKAGAPLTLVYHAGAATASSINYTGNTVRYEIVSNGKDALPQGANDTDKKPLSTGCATYGTYSLQSPTASYTRYAFDGWYSDSALTNKLASSVVVTADTTFYGTYNKVAGLITTGVEHGTITETDDNVPYGTDKTIEYRAEDGYFLQSVTVDGKKVAVEDYPFDYTFTDVQDDHDIKVVYAPMTEPKKMGLTLTGQTISEDSAGNPIQTVMQAGDEIVYKIAFSNPADSKRTFTVTDVLPEGLKFLDASGDYKYDEDTRKIVWTVPVAGGEDTEVTATVKVLKAAEGTILTNTATLSVDDAKKTTNKTETPIFATPKKDAVDGDGKSIDTMPVTIGEEFSYTISYENPSDVEKTATISDALPKGVEYVSSDHDGAYDKDNHAVNWKVSTKAHEKITLSVKVKVSEDAAGTELNNQATVSMDQATLTTESKNDGSAQTRNYVTKNMS